MANGEDFPITLFAYRLDSGNFLEYRVKVVIGSSEGSKFRYFRNNKLRLPPQSKICSVNTVKCKAMIQSKYAVTWITLYISAKD